MTLAPDEYARLLRQHLPRMARLAVRLCGDVHAAEDLVSEAMLRATRHYPDFRCDSAFGTWLYRIVINAFRDRLRSRPDAPPTGAFAEPPDPAPSPADRLGTAELAERVALLVSNLPPRQREALVLTTYEAMSGEEAAAVMQTTAQNVRVLVHHARTRLKEQLGPLVEERP